MNREIDSYQRRLDHLFGQITSFAHDAELQSHWAKYLCVLVSGFLEVSIASIYKQYAEDKSAKFVANFVQSQVSRINNPKMERIITLSKSFNPEWADELETLTAGRLKDSVNSIVNNRNQIAHGQNIGLSFHSMEQYYEDAVKVVKLIYKQCKLKEI